MKIQLPRGTQDLLPPLSERFDAHERMGADLFASAGYQRIVTPMFEDTALFVRGVGEGSDIVNKEMYTFNDRSENSLTLRPEGTSSVMRAVISNHLWDQGLPIKLWYTAAMFRYDRPQKGRYRQHHQLGIEAIGIEDPAVDAEVIWLGREMLDRAGVPGSTLLLNSVGHPGCRAEYMPRLKEFLAAHRERLDEDCRRRMETNPLRVFDCKNEADQALLADAPVLERELCADCRAHFDAVQAYLKDLGVAFEIAPRLVRGLDYYTRTAFEFQTPLLEAAQNTVCGGGRYDGLSAMIGGPALPGIGFGSGIERVLLAQEQAAAVPAQAGPDVFVVPTGDAVEEAKRAALQLAAELRARGLSADIAFADRQLRKHLARASDVGARYVAILGATEIAEGTVTIKHMESGEQTTVPRDTVFEHVSGRDGKG